jgi:transglutaminase-like putative cysteine protease
MKQRIVQLCALLMIGGTMYAGDILYPVSAIAPALKENANAVVRNYSEEVTLIGEGKYSKKVSWAITILNENGQDESEFKEYYDKNSHLSNIKAAVYNAAGERVKKLGTSDIMDYSAITGFTIYDDNRVKVISPAYRTVPYTVEYSYEYTQDEGFYYPSWSPVSGYYIATEKAQFKVITPNENILRYKELNFDQRIVFQKGENEGKKTLTWGVSNYAALTPEPYSPSNKEFMPILLMAPVTFTVNGIKGDLSSWQSFGDFIGKLNNGRQELPPATVAKVKELIKDCPDTRSKVRKLYEYMQQKTRYVSIQIGIGGFQPFPAETVDRLGYGDCKALSNYMKALLNAAGIPSKYLLINAGENGAPVITDFPSTQFNHATLCVPMPSDTIWLECTSQTSPFGYIGDFTDNRYALLIDSVNSKIVKTKSYTLADNVQKTNTSIALTTEGNGNAEINTLFTGNYYGDNMRLMQIDEKNKKEAISNWLRIPSYILQSYQLKEDKSDTPSINQQLKVLIQNQFTSMGSKVLLTLNPINYIKKLPTTVKNRKNKVLIRRPLIECDTINYTLPAGYTVEKIPAAIDIISKFGEYHSTCKTSNNQITYYREFKLLNGSFSPEEYEQMRDFLSKVMNADQVKCIIQKPI